MKLVNKKFNLEELRLERLIVEEKTRLCDRAFAHFFAKNASARRLLIGGDQMTEENLSGFVDAFSSAHGSEFSLISLNYDYLSIVSSPTQFDWNI